MILVECILRCCDISHSFWCAVTMLAEFGVKTSINRKATFSVCVWYTTAYIVKLLFTIIQDVTQFVLMWCFDDIIKICYIYRDRYIEFFTKTSATQLLLQLKTDWIFFGIDVLQHFVRLDQFRMRLN